jgi:hypothetical protein
MRHVTIGALLLASVALVVQGRRIMVAENEIVTLGEQVVRAGGENHVYRANILGDINHVLAELDQQNCANWDSIKGFFT